MKRTRQEFILGTVQLGMEYGINNQSGRPDREEAFHILNTAAENHIRYLDTAAAYGDSEKIIGEYQREYCRYFKVCTKLPVSIREDNTKSIEQAVENTLNTLGIDNVEILYLHRFEQCQDQHIIESMMREKEKGKIKRTGISIYEPVELEYIIDHLSSAVDAVQIPFNILDNYRWKDIIRRAHEKSILIFARSVYLQGLLFMNEKDEAVKKIKAEEYVRFVRKLAEEKQVSVARLLLDFIKSSEVDGILIGCERAEQLLENIRYFEGDNCLTDKDLQLIEAVTKNVPAKVTDPRKW